MTCHIEEKNIHTLFEMETGKTQSSLENKRSTLRALNLKRDNMAAEIGYLVRDTIPSYPKWMMHQVNFDDPRIADMKEPYFKLIEKISKLSKEVDRLESLEDNDLPRHEARVKAYNFLNKLSDQQATTFLKQHRLTTVTLTEAVLLCPTLLDDLSNLDENLELIRSKPEVWW